METDKKLSSSTASHDEKSASVEHVNRSNSEVLVDTDLMNDAYEGENREHAEGMWASVKAHPWACFWAFIMCFTIVSQP